jgi:hypothetical protein
LASQTPCYMARTVLSQAICWQPKGLDCPDHFGS